MSGELSASSLYTTVCGGGTTPGTGQYCGIDLHNDTTPDFNKTGQYSATLFAEEAVRLIHKKV